MTSTAHEVERKTEPEVQHPPWCGQQAVECTGDAHQSMAVRVELDEYAGCAVRAYLRGSSKRIFVEVEFISEGALDAAAAAWERLELAAGEDAGTRRDRRANELHRISAEAVRALVYGREDGDGDDETADEPDRDDEQEPEARAASPKQAVVFTNPLDPVYVEDPHGHSVSVEQAELLAGLLHYLVRAARGGDVAVLRAAAELT